MDKGQIFFLIYVTITIAVGTTESSQSSESKKLCRLIPFIVNTTDIIEDIINPERVDLGYCSGSCKTSNPDLQRKLYNHHSFLKSLAGQESCCVPIKLKPLQVHIDNKKLGINMESVLPEMIVESCGCR